jgi:uncharacterized membrane protein SirB2
MEYLALKHFHMTMAGLSGSLFLLRGAWMATAPARLERGWVKWLPHLVDTLLLASAIGLAVWSHQYPGQQPWLTAKIAALVVYIVLGAIALKRGRTLRVRLLALAGALAAFGYIAGCAVTKDPAFFLRLFA